MNEEQHSIAESNKEHYVLIKPFKSMACAILLAVFLGPIGLLYASFLGGVVMAVMIFIFLAAATANNAVMPLVWLAWLVCPFWAVLSTGRQNKKLLQEWQRNR